MDNVSELAPSTASLDVSEPFSKLHPVAITGPEQIRRLLEIVWREDIVLTRGMNRRILPEKARIMSVDSVGITLQTTDFAEDVRHRILLNYSIDDKPYFFNALFLEQVESDRVRIEIPAVIYQSERRDRRRSTPSEGGARRVALLSEDNSEEHGEILDSSPQGLGIAVERRIGESLKSNCRIRFLDGDRKGQVVFGEVRQTRSMASRAGWVQIGLDISSSRRTERLVERVGSPDGVIHQLGRMRKRVKVVAAGAKSSAMRTLERVRRTARELPEVRILEVRNDDNEPIVAIVDSTGDTRGAPVVVIPPAWGKTKESLMPLAMCIVSSFEEAGNPVAVVRFDGVRKRGESFSEVNRKAPGADHHRFTFSQGVRDIETVIDSLERMDEFSPSNVIVVSFSAAAIEARRAVADDKRIGGWVSVVGAPDLQSMMRVISGGVDFAAGLERGIGFGMQEILGIEVDMDHAGLDAFRHNLIYLEDARSDMSRIQVPITWIHGKYDAWMDRERALDALSRGSASNRKFVEVPTGHMLRTSHEALETFQLVTREISRMLSGRELEPVLPDLNMLQARARAERSRLVKEKDSYQGFWRDYLVGKGADIGIELMTSISPYQELMSIQVQKLKICDGDMVVDLGAGTGSFPLFASSASGPTARFRIIETDFVREGFSRARERLKESRSELPFALEFVEANLDVEAGNSFVPLRSGSADSVIASLLISYLREPQLVLAEIFRILKPGGRVVVSSLRRDADMSKLYIEGIDELRMGLARERFGRSGETEIDQAARAYLNQASKLLDLEEAGAFQFWGADELMEMVSRAGFHEVGCANSLGDPPQAIVVWAVR